MLCGFVKKYIAAVLALAVFAPACAVRAASDTVYAYDFEDSRLPTIDDGGAEFEDNGTPIYLYPNTNTAIRQADLVFPVNGDSMEPEYHDGDLVLVEKYPGCPELQYDEVGAFMVGNSTYIKIYEEEGLVSFNDKYDTMTFTEYDNVTLIGRVLGILEPASVASKRDAERYETMHQDDEE